MKPTRTCRHCRARLPENSPGGLCVPCLLQLGLTAGGDAAALENEPAAADAAAQPAELAGEFADYQVIQLLGEGGCGRVYLAQQLRPVRRQVALKVIKRGMDTAQVIARFEAERQALALMEHPNIAQVLGAGTTRSGRPFFVMELVRGPKLTEFCDQHRLGPRQRLELLIQVCHAVQHAHQKGIIHRDLKPSNVLVALQDGVPVPKVIDFGIAKATGGVELTDKTLFTAFEQFLGTPAYMSPEQASLGRLDVDTRSDIYSLGVLLYELLAGSPPFDGQELLRRGIEAVFFTIRETEPPRPSTQLTLLAADILARVARERGLEPPRLVGAVRGDLDWIVMKALEKDRTRRYATANSLAADLQRHLNHEPVAARPPSRLYRLQRTMRRHRTLFAAGAVVLVTLALALAATLGLLSRERQALEQARTSTAEAQAVLGFLQTNVIAAACPQTELGGLGKDATIRQALEAAEPKLGVSFAGQPLVEARVREDFGLTFVRLGAMSQAIRQHEQALALRRATLGPQHTDTLESLAALAFDCQVDGQWSRSVQLWQESVQAAGQRFGPRARRTLELRCALGLAQRYLQDYAESDATLSQVVADSLATLGPDDPLTLEVMNALGYNHFARQRYAQAAALLEPVLAHHRATFGATNLETTRVLVDVARAYQGQGDWAKALPMLLEAVAIRRGQQGPDHDATLLLVSCLAESYALAGAWPEATATAREVWLKREQKLGSDHPETLASRQQLAEALLGGAWAGRAQPLHSGAPVLAAARAHEAEDHLRAAFARAELVHKPQDCRRIELKSLLGYAAVVVAATDTDPPAPARLARLPAAEQALIECWHEYQTAAAVTPGQRRRNLQYLARLYGVWNELAPDTGKAAQADLWQRRLDEFVKSQAAPAPVR